MKRRRLRVADEHPDQSFALFHRIGFDFCFADNRRIRSIGQGCNAHAAADVEGPAMITAGYGIGSGKFTSADGKRNAAMGAAILDGKTFALMADEEQTFSEDL